MEKICQVERPGNSSKTEKSERYYNPNLLFSYGHWYTWNLGRNHVNETARLGIVAHCFWEENLGNVTEVFVNDSFGFVAQSLQFCSPNYPKRENNNSKSFLSDIGFRQWNQRVRATIPKESLTKTSAQLCSPNFPPKDHGQRSHALRFRLRDRALIVCTT